MPKTECPVCRKVYQPVLGERKHPEVLIQREFPHSESWQREQLVTGICSDECWDKATAPQLLSRFRLTSKKTLLKKKEES